MAIAFSVFVPEIIAPFAHGVPMDADFRESADSIFAGAKQYKFMRALFGLSVSAAIGVTVTLFTRPEPVERQRGLVWGTVADAIRWYKGSAGEERTSRKARAMPQAADVEREPRGEGHLPPVRISSALASALDAKADALVYVSDARAWRGGLRSVHAIVDEVFDDDVARIELGPATFDLVVSAGRKGREIIVERLY